MENSTHNPVLSAIFQRRSIREFTDEAVPLEQLRSIVEAGTWAPSGLNNQPWRFVLIQDPKMRDRLAALTRYSHIVAAAQGLIAVFLDTATMYDEVKDHQAAGACIQNMLLASEAIGLGGVWLGQILANKTQVNELLAVPDTLDLMAVIALGHPAHRHQKADRKPLSAFIIKEL
jgi:nitroreductase